MAIPPKGDPRRPLHLAVRTCRVLGTLSLVLGVFALVSLAIDSGRGGMHLAAPLIGLIFYGGPGAAYLVFAHSMVRRRFWALVAALVLTGASLLFMAMGALVMAIMILSGAFKSPANATAMTAVLWGSIAFELLIAVALGQLVCWLARSFPAMKIGPDEAYGFDVLPVPVMPAASDTTVPGGADVRR